MKVVVAADRVSFIPERDDDELLQRIETAVIHVLDMLPHTPLSGIGQNFRYAAEETTSQLEQVLQFSDADSFASYGSVSEVSLQRSLTLEDCQLNLKIVSGPSPHVELNYHYAVSNANEAAKVMENTYLKNRDYGLGLLQNVYTLTLNEESSDDQG